MGKVGGPRRLVAALVAVAALVCAGLLSATVTRAVTADGWPVTPSAHHAPHGLPALAHECRRSTLDPAAGHPVPLSEDSGRVGPDDGSSLLPDHPGDRPAGGIAPLRRADRAPPTVV